MCGRFTLTVSPQQLRAVFGYPEQPNFPPRFNIAPTQPIATVRLMNGQRHFTLVRWGLLPSWVKDSKQVSVLFNARGESINEKPAFKAAMRHRRCLIPADGFYEWQAAGPKSKRPYFIRRKDNLPFAFAGLWETWSGPNGEELDTATIVTTHANQALAPIHERMPVVLAETDFELWLNTRDTDTASASKLIKPPPNVDFEAYRVNSSVGSTANDNAALIAPWDLAMDQADIPEHVRRTKADDDQPSLF